MACPTCSQEVAGLHPSPRQGSWCGGLGVGEIGGGWDPKPGVHSEGMQAVGELGRDGGRTSPRWQEQQAGSRVAGVSGQAGLASSLSEGPRQSDAHVSVAGMGNPTGKGK
jgi:hypothetical protein